MDSFFLDDTNNTLRFDPADCDGFHLCESEGKGKVYVYYSEIPILMGKLASIRNKEICKGDKYYGCKLDVDLVQVIAKADNPDLLDYLAWTFNNAYKALRAQLITHEEISVLDGKK